ncbi:MAG: hypothetical protein LBF22_13505 [Deltaproteobacteria bacterium]|nr:hypothetical protein [Deltaproteobacteria bacterium]
MVFPSPRHREGHTTSHRADHMDGLEGAARLAEPDVQLTVVPFRNLAFCFCFTTLEL